MALQNVFKTSQKVSPAFETHFQEAQTMEKPLVVDTSFLSLRPLEKLSRAIHLENNGDGAFKGAFGGFNCESQRLEF